VRVAPKKLGPVPVRTTEPEVDWSDYPRIEAGVYPGYSRAAHWYYDPNYKRWVCHISFDVLSADLLKTIARLPWFLNGGEGAQPKAGRRSRYWSEWVRATGRAPSKGDRLSPAVFVARIATVEVWDTDSATPCSVIGRILSWDTGSIGQAVTSSRKA
jgi:hypothetical protein